MIKIRNVILCLTELITICEINKAFARKDIQKQYVKVLRESKKLLLTLLKIQKNEWVKKKNSTRTTSIMGRSVKKKQMP